MTNHFSKQIVIRITLWLFIFMTEILNLSAVKAWHTVLGHDAIHVCAAVLVLLATFRLGEGKLIVDFRDLCFYDVLVQSTGWWLYFHGYELEIYYALNYSIAVLKFTRLLWLVQGRTSDLLKGWPVFGPFSYWESRKNLQGKAEPASSFFQRDSFVYVLLIATTPVIYALREMGAKMIFAYWALIGVAIILRYFEPFMAYLDKRESEFIENKEKAAILTVTEAKNAELHAKNLELAQAKADAERAREEAVKARQDAEQARDEAERAKANEETISRALRTAAHDLRQNIALIGFAGHEIVKARSLAEKEEALETFYDVNFKVTEAIEQIMYYAKLTTKAAEPKLEALEMCSTLFDLCTQWRNAGFEKGVEALLAYPRKEGVEHYVACDPMLVNHVLQNLVINAILHGGDGCDRIVLCVRSRADHYLVQIRDCGKGIEEGEGPDQQANFIAFAQRVYERSTQRGDGHGLGINIVKQMCEVAQIPIGLRSRLGKGAAFSLRLPKASAALIAESKARIADSIKQRENAKVQRRPSQG